MAEPTKDVKPESTTEEAPAPTVGTFVNFGF